ncbi:hypothetical protein [Nonomuraea sp. NPDC049709]|uniref:hypothetical protein n=1 Tax=Nonomuraea sp. NPDC049709 TaxID=3154736 RepID=UPI00343428B8
MIAPIARDSDAVILDADEIKVAETIFDAYANQHATGGLSHSDLRKACDGICDDETFLQRFRTFRALGMLVPAFPKKNNGLYLFHPYSAAGLAVFDRVSAKGGIDELLTLLDRTRAAIARGSATAEQVKAVLTRSRGMLVIAADYLLMLVRERSIETMIAERHLHQHPALLQDVEAVMDLVSTRYPELDRPAYAVTIETQRYLGARSDFVARLLEEGARAQDFGLLSHEQYLTAARERSQEELAAAFAQVVFDPPNPWLSPPAIVREVEAANPRKKEPPRPPRPNDAPVSHDPLQRVLDRERRRRDSAWDQAALALQGNDEADITDLLLHLEWPAAARLLATLLRAAHSGKEFEVEFKDALRVDPHAKITYLSPVVLRRRGRGRMQFDHQDGDHQ